MQPKDTKTIILLGIAAVVAVILTASLAAFATIRALTPEEKAEETATSDQVTAAPVQKAVPVAAPAPQPVQHVQTAQQQPQQIRCNDGNIVGKVAGGIGGGALASNVGKGRGKTAAVIGGTLGGAYLGGEFLPTHNVTCR